MKKPEVEIVESSEDLGNDPNDIKVYEEHETPKDLTDDEKYEKVTTRCTAGRCTGTTAYKVNALRTGSISLTGAASNMVMFRCTTCKHTWSIGY